MPSVGCPRTRSCRSSTPTANGTRESGSSVRVTVTFSSGSRVTRAVSAAAVSPATGSWAVAAEGRANAMAIHRGASRRMDVSSGLHGY